MSSTALSLILFIVVILLLRALARLAGRFADMSIMATKGLFATLGTIVIVIAVLVLLGGVAVAGGDLLPSGTGTGARPELATVPGVSTRPPLVLNPVDPDNPGVG